MARMNSVIYSLNNPDSKLPLDELLLAAYLYIEIEVSGLNENGEHCTQKFDKSNEKSKDILGIIQDLTETYGVLYEKKIIE